MAYDVAAIRNKLKKQMSGKFVDPDEFRPPKAESSTDPTKFRFYILPPVAAGEKLKSGVVGDDQGMEHFFVPHANHWINDRPYPCPRVWDSSDCKICQTGFDLLKEEKDDERRKSILRTWMPNTYYMVNIFFTNSKMNPEDLRGKVRFYNAPKTLFDIWSATLMKDDAGDPEDPEAFGVFFDENAAFMFQLEVLKHGRNNSYKTSHFVANGGNPQPMLKDEEQLKKLLRMRLNLHEKVEKPEQEKIERLARTMLDGDDFDDDDDGGFDEDEVSSKKSDKKSDAKESKKESKAESKKADKKAKPKDDDDDDDDEDALVDEAPLDDDDDDAVVADDDDAKEEPKKESKKETKKESKPAASDDDDDDDDEIDALLDQLEDDDD